MVLANLMKSEKNTAIMYMERKQVAIVRLEGGLMNGLGVSCSLIFHSQLSFRWSSVN